MRWLNTRGGVDIGDNVHISYGSMVLSSGLDKVNRKIHINKKIIIGNNVWIGAGSIILPGVKIGNNATVGAGAVVSRDVTANVTVVGNPAKEI